MKKILVLGATGNIGHLLVEQLLNQNEHVRAAGRSRSKLESMKWAGHPGVELAQVDISQKDQVFKICQDCSVIYYLVHSMNPEQKDFEQTDRNAAHNIIEVAQQMSVERIIYLGGLGDSHDSLSPHLRSRMEVGKILHSGTIQATTLRAAMIIGVGSVSFEILKNLVDRLPVMITPRWVDTQSQPIAVDNVIYYLVELLRKPETRGQVYDIGGPDILSYRQLMDIYAMEAGLRKRMIISVPVLSPGLSAKWIRLITGVPSVIAKPLAEGLKNRVVCEDHRIRSIIPQELISCQRAIQLVLQS